MEGIDLTVLWVLIIGVVVGLLAWFGPRPSQWRSHQGEGGDPGEEPRPEE